MYLNFESYEVCSESTTGLIGQFRLIDLDTSPD